MKEVKIDEKELFINLSEIGGNGMSGNGLSGDGLSGNGMSGNGLSGDGLSGNGIDSILESINLSDSEIEEIIK